MSEIDEKDLMSEILLFFGSNLVQSERLVYLTREYILASRVIAITKPPKINMLKAADELST